VEIILEVRTSNLPRVEEEKEEKTIIEKRGINNHSSETEK